MKSRLLTHVHSFFSQLNEAGGKKPKTADHVQDTMARRCLTYLLLLEPVKLHLRMKKMKKWGPVLIMLSRQSAFSSSKAHGWFLLSFESFTDSWQRWFIERKQTDWFWKHGKSTEKALDVSLVKWECEVLLARWHLWTKHLITVCLMRVFLVE